MPTSSAKMVKASKQVYKVTTFLSKQLIDLSRKEKVESEIIPNLSENVILSWDKIKREITEMIDRSKTI